MSRVPLLTRLFAGRPRLLGLVLGAAIALAVLLVMVLLGWFRPGAWNNL